MNSYADYTDLLFSTNFVGGSGKNDLSTVSGEPDERAEIDKDGNGIYQFYYYSLTSTADLDSLGYYTAGVDREYTQLPANGPALNAIQTAIVSDVLTSSTWGVSFSDVAKVNFNNSQTTSTADIIFGATTSGGNPQIYQTTGGYERDYSTNHSALQHGDVWLNNEASAFWDSSDVGSLGYLAGLHEVSHSLGVDVFRPENRVDSTKAYNNDSQDPNYNPLKPELEYLNSHKYTVTSYNFLEGMEPPSTPNDEVAPFGLQLLDIAAIQEIYGINWDTRTGNTTYSKMTAFNSSRPNDAFIYTIWDGDGVDTISADGYYQSGVGAGALSGADIDLRQGAFSSIGSSAEAARAVDNVAIAYNAIIENAIGSHLGDEIIGNAWDNKLEGGDGNDYIYGDGVVKDGDAGYGAGVGEHNPNNPTSGPASDNSGNDELYGGAGDDHLYGGAGDDLLNGGSGSDAYYFTLNGGTNTIVDDWNNENKIVLDDNINFADITITEVGNDLVYTHTDSTQFILKDILLFEDKEILTEHSQNPNSDGSTSSMILMGSDNNDSLALWTYYYKTTSIIAFGKGGDDIINGTAYADVIYGGSGNDTITAWKGDYYIEGGTGNDNLGAGDGDGVIYGGDGNDGLSASNEGVFELYGGSGNDRFDAGSSKGASLFNDISGDEEYYYSSGQVLGTLDINDQSGNDAYYIANRDVYINDSGSGDDYYESFMTDNGYLKISENGGNDHFSFRVNKHNFDGSIQSGNDLIVSFYNGTKELTIVDYYLGNQKKLETISFEDTGILNFDYLENDTNYILGSNNNDLRLFGNFEDNLIYGFDGHDRLYAQDGDDTLFGGEGRDTLYGQNGVDTLYGDTDDDTLVGGSGNDILNGGDGIDTANYSTSTAAIAVSLHAQTAYDDGYGDEDRLYLIENIVGSDHNDWITGSNGANTLSAGAGDDSIYARDGDDVLHGNEGEDILRGGDGDDTIYGGAGDDINLNGDNGDDEIHGGDGADKLYGAAGLDTLYGDDGADIISGHTGNDALYGGLGNDELYGGDDNDTLHGEAGDDLLKGDAGTDELHGGDGIDTLYGGDGADTLYGDAGVDNLSGGLGDDVLYGGTGDDALYGQEDNDTLYGDDGADNLRGQDGDDALHGGAGSDYLRGGNGNDTLEGGADRDYLYGEDGVDTFLFEMATAYGQYDYIQDYSAGDKLDISGLLEGFTDGVSDINDYLVFGEASGHTYGWIYQDGTTSSATQGTAFRISNTTGLDVDTLFNNNEILATALNGV